MKRCSAKAVLIVTLLGVLAGCSQPQVLSEPRANPVEAPVEVAAKEVGERAPKRIIFLIGDGMGVPALTAATYAKGAPLSVLGMEHLGLVTTHSYEFVTTDSAAAATALATGRKTHFEGVSLRPGTTLVQEQDPAHHLPTLLEKAEAAGWKTGLVATVRLNHATPGAFAGHRVGRRQYDEIALDMAASGVDVMIGGGRKYFDQRKDGKNLLAGLKEQGYAIANTPEAMQAATNTATQMIALLGPSDLGHAGDAQRPGLTEMMKSAIKVLERDNDEGFLLMVEGSQIDWRAHDLDGEGVVREMLEFDETIQAALEYAAGRDDTLVVVTADHETGGLAVLDAAQVNPLLEAAGGEQAARDEVARPGGIEAKYPSPEHLPTLKIGEFGQGTPEFAGLGALAEVEGSAMRLSFGHLSLASRGLCQEPRRFSATHTSAMVSVHAQGPGARSIVSSKDNAVLGARLMALVGAETVPVYASSEDAKLAEATAEQTPTNIILMIGSGMGVGALTAAYYGHGPLAMQQLPVQGLVATHGADRLANDAAASATALATGQRSQAGALGVVAEGDGWKHLETLLERSEQAGMKTGLVTSAAVTDPTTAAFYAHVPQATQTAEIAESLADLGARVEGSDGVDVVLAAEDMDTSSLAKLTERALEALANQDKGAKDNGFLLVVNEARIDSTQRALRRDRGLVDAMLDFDAAVGKAMAFARADANTLVLVTGDRDYSTSVIDQHYGHNPCARAALRTFGGPFALHNIAVAPKALGPVCEPVSAVTLANQDTVACQGDEALRVRLQREFAPLQFSLQYGWVAQVGATRAEKTLEGPTSANFVPLFAFGPGSNAFGGFHDQPKLGQMLQAFVSGR